ncbi:MAG: caspase family protein [bacterium]|nr:caspase family protein [bacterium]
MAVNPTDYALVVGINHYPDYTSLNGAINDAMNIEKWLLDENGGGLEAENCKKILSVETEPPIPFQNQIDRALYNLLRQSEATGGRRFYFYFSGHGLGTEIDDNALCLAGWSEDFRHEALSSRCYLNRVMHYGIFKEVIFLLDCCSNRLINHNGSCPRFDLARPDDATGDSRHLVAFATEYQDSSYEAVSGNDGSGQVRGHFTTAVLSGLYGAAKDQKGLITPAGLAEYIVPETSRIADEHNQIQKVRVVNTFTNMDAVVFGPPHTSPVTKMTVTCTITFRQGRTGPVRLEAGNLDILKEAPAEAGPWVLELEPGLHLLIAIDTGDEQNIRVRPGEAAINVSF